MEKVHEQRIKTLAEDVLESPEELTRIERRLMGGMSNYTYVVRANTGTYTFRILGKGAEKFVDRKEEAHHLSLIEPLCLNNETIHLDTETGDKIATFIEGAPLHEKDPAKHLGAVASTLRRLHESGLQSPHLYNPFRRLKRYEGHVRKLGKTHEKTYHLAKAHLLSFRTHMERPDPILIHGDAQPSNFIVTSKGFFLTDWEFSGMGHPFHDIACFGNIDFEHALSLLPVYLERGPKPEEERLLRLFRLYQCLLWHNVALYKHEIGLSEELLIPFDKVAKKYLSMARDLQEETS